MKYTVVIIFSIILSACGGGGSTNITDTTQDPVPPETPPPVEHPAFGTPLSDPYCSPSNVQERFITLLTLVQDIADGSGGKQVEVIEQDSTKCGYAADCPTQPSGDLGDFPYITCDGIRQRTDIDFAYSAESTYVNTVDMLIIFDSAVDTQGLTMEQFVQRELDFANQVFARSNVYIELQVAKIHTQEFAPQETLRTLIYPLGDNTDPFAWVTDAQREAGADIVMLFLSRRETPIACGVAYLDGTRGIGKTRGITQCYQNTVFQPDYLRYYNRAHETFTHEVGHILGLDHDLSNAGNAYGIFEYSYGYQEDDVELGTIMSYSNEPFKRFSDPDEREEVDGVSYSIGSSDPITTDATEHLNRVRDTMSKLDELHSELQPQQFKLNINQEDFCVY